MHIFTSDSVSQLIVDFDQDVGSDWDDPVNVLIRREEQQERERELDAIHESVKQKLGKTRSLTWYKRLSKV